MEVLGGNGYVEESVLPRIFREAPVNSIWEGSGNVMCLDVLRALDRTPGAAAVLREELGEGARADARLAAIVARVERRLADGASGDETQARAFTRDLVLALQATLLLRHAPSAIADAFCAARLSGEAGAFGLLPPGTALRAIIERAAPRAC
jgi:putative acyl-CoA dehydrogenase